MRAADLVCFLALEQDESDSVTHVMCQLADMESSRSRANAGGASSGVPTPAKKSQPRPPTESSASSHDADLSGASRSGSSSSSRALSGSIASNRKRTPAQESPSAGGSRQAASHLQRPLSAGVAETVTPEGLREELKGKESMIDAIQTKLECWEATTLATLQEIRDLKQIFTDLKQ